MPSVSPVPLPTMIGASAIACTPATIRDETAALFGVVSQNTPGPTPSVGDAGANVRAIGVNTLMAAPTTLNGNPHGLKSMQFDAANSRVPTTSSSAA